MEPDAIAELEQILREERDAIRKLDGARVLSYAKRKESLVVALRQGKGTLSASNAARLRGLTPSLRHNSVLLAHARDILRDALAIARTELGATTSAQTATRATVPRLLSVRG
jgi:hypothetical protein